MKRHLLYTLALPVFVLICNCSHLPSGNTESDQGTAQAPAVSVSLPPGSPQQDAPAAKSAAPAPARIIAGNKASTIDRASADDLPPGEGVAAKELAAGDCPKDDPDCEAAESSEDKTAQAVLDEALEFCDVAQSSWQKGELDNALEALDKAYSLIFEVDTRQDPKLMQQKEDLRFLISKRILEIYASRNTAVNGAHDEIPMEINEHIEAELKLFTVGREKEAFFQAYQRSGRYRPYILQALAEAGLPEELSWLPLIESGYKVKALSTARALGLWQFIPSTGYKFGLKRDSYIDERIDFMKSTHAAIAYLKELHNIFGDWATVLAAYNCGEGRVLRTIRTQNVNYLDNFWDLYQRLPRETARYVPRFFATLHIVKNPEKYGLENVAFESPLVFDQVEVNRQVHLKEIGKILEMDQAELEIFNPELRYYILPPEPYSLRIPKGKLDILLASLESIPTCTLPQRPALVYHKVRPGESLASIAHRYQTSVSAIMQANNMKKSRVIHTGRKLKIPVSSGSIGSAPQARPTSDFTGVHTVAQGDSLYNLAQRYNTTVKQISAMNNLSSSTLYVGQKIQVASYKPEPLPDAAKLRTYYVQRGDSPFSIAQKYKLTLDRLLSINQLTPSSKIYPGQKLLVE